MASIKNSLKIVYKSLSGGKNSKAKSISGIIDDISTVASGGGGSTRVIFDVSMESGETGLVCDKTFNQIISAVNSGDVSFAVRDGETGVILQSSEFSYGDNQIFLTFMSPNPGVSATLNVLTIGINSENRISLNSYSIQLT